MSTPVNCQKCGALVAAHKNPIPTVDIVIAHPGMGIVLVKRRYPPLGWALPGGFVDYGETVQNAALREAKEETGLDVELGDLLGVYSDPARDSRLHTISIVFTARCSAPSSIKGGDDASEARFFLLNALPDLVFDHKMIIQDFAGSLPAQYGATLGKPAAIAQMS